MTQKKLGILLTNIGTPDAPTPSAVRRYLKAFLSDRRVIALPPILWKPILYGIILRTRPKKSAELYQKIWTEEGSPLLFHTQDIAIKLQEKLSKKFNQDIPVTIGMNYSNPSIKSGLETLRAQGMNQLCVLPMYPQYSATSTASSIDAVCQTFKTWRAIPACRFIDHYADHPSYIQAISDAIRDHWKKNEKSYLLFSFHGIPQKYAEAGDPYADLCQLSARLIAENLKLNDKEWSVSFQSRLGPTKWLSPYTDHVLAALPKQNIKRIQVVCPGFAVDCLETLEEIAIRGKEQFLEAGGESFDYIPALNSSDAHIEMLATVIVSANARNDVSNLP